MNVAIVRGIADAYRGAIRAVPVPIDVARARSQHADYVAVLEALGFAILALPPDERFPDGCFVEDQAIVVGGRALIARSGHPGRRAEAATVAAALEALGVAIIPMDDGALDGGDVLRVGSTLFVGDSGRTDAAGRGALARAFPDHEVRVLRVPDGILHLKSVCSSPVPGLVVMAEGAVPDGTFDAVDVIVVPAAEAWAANLVGAEQTVVVGAGYPATKAALEAAGLRTLVVEASEIRAGDGGLTCLSILLSRPGRKFAAVGARGPTATR